MTIFDLMQAQELTAYWNELVQDEPPYLAEVLFPDDKKRGLSLKWLKGAKGLPVVLNASAFDVFAIPRARIGFEKLSAEMPYFKESTYIDEELRQELNMVLETGNQAYIDSAMNKIFDDETQLLRGARARREMMRMMVLTTGVLSLSSNGQSFTYDYGIPAEHKGDAAVPWTDHTNSDPIEDIRLAKEKIQEDTGAVLTRAICDGAVWRNLRANEKIKKELFVLTNGLGSISDAKLRDYIMQELEISVEIYDKRYKDDNGNTVKFMPSGTFAMFPDGALGKTWFGTTPAESDLMTGEVANVSITDTGVAVTTVKKADPVQVETIVSMICLPSFEMADQVYIIDAEQNISIDKTTLALNSTTKTTGTITATTIPAGGTVTWKSDKETVATVAAGVATYVGPGTAHITAEYAGDKAVCTVTCS